jgi:hypothetical protein
LLAFQILEKFAAFCCEVRRLATLSRGLLVGLLLSAVCTAAHALEEVRVGAYHFPPYVIKPESDRAGGLLPQLLQALNQLQSD